MSSGTRRDHVERVEGLLASVQDLVATLQKLGAELEQEVAQALYQGNSPAESAQATLELENARLRLALEGRAVIEQAKGMIIAGQGGTAEAAFAVLTRLARQSQRTVREVAADILSSGSYRPAPGSSGDGSGDDTSEGTAEGAGGGSAGSSGTGPDDVVVTLPDAAPAQTTTAQTTTAQAAPVQATTVQATTVQATTVQATTVQANTAQAATVQATTAAINLDEAIERSEPSGDPVRRRWRPLHPSHASTRKDAPRFRNSGG
jgi:ANTAR domain